MSEKHYTHIGNGQFKTLDNIPYHFIHGSIVIYNNKIHIIGSTVSGDKTKHYSWNGTSWTDESTLPYDFSYGSAVAYDNKIHILGGLGVSDVTKHFSWDGTSWSEESTLPYDFVRFSTFSISIIFLPFRLICLATMLNQMAVVL